VGGAGNRGGSADSSIVGSAEGGAIYFTIDQSGQPGQGTVSGCTLTDNQAVGGAGNLPGTGAASVLGQASGGGIGNAFGQLMVTNSTLAHNQAVGGAGSPGQDGGDGLGGGVANALGGTLVVSSTTVDHNKAQGGDGVKGGDGLGGGIYEDAAPSSLTLNGVAVRYNFALGGSGGPKGGDGDGIGGGVYILGTFDPDSATVITKNHASTSHDDIGP
jgi:hypothetical protein